MTIKIDFNKLFIFVSKIFKYLFIKPKTPTTMTDLRKTTNDYNDAIELAPSLNQIVLNAQAALKPLQDALDLALKEQFDNVTLSENLKAQILQALNPVTPVVPASETETTV
jgi:hypothetical protein